MAVGILFFSPKVQKQEYELDPVKVAFCVGAGWDTYSDFGVRAGGVISIKCTKYKQEWAFYEWPPTLKDNGTWK